MMLHNSHQPFFREPAGPAPAGSDVTVRFLCDEAAAVTLRLWTDDEHLLPMTDEGESVWSATFTLPEETGWAWYYFMIERKDGTTVRYGNAYDQMGGEGAVYKVGDVASYQITVYKPGFKTPCFMHGANIYQIFPDRFYRAATNARDDRKRFVHEDWDEDFLHFGDKRGGSYMIEEFYGGTLTGIQEKLPYLKELGITVLYLNPIFRARSNHRYDTGDYTKIDPLLGTEEEFSALCEAAERMGIRIILDGVFSHTGRDSLYFNRDGNYESLGAYQSKESPYADWFTFRKFPDSYACWWEDPNLPTVRKENAEYQQYMFQDHTGVVPRWIRAGASGWRLDVADELPMDFLRKLRVAAKRAKRDALVLGEVWEDASNKVAYGQMRNYCTGDTLDSVMNYPLREAIISFVTGETTAYELARLLNHQAEVYPAQFRYALMNLIGSHDRARILNVLCGKTGEGIERAKQQFVKLTDAEYALAVKRMRTCIDILCALPGCPTVYYGDEVGMTGCPDPYCRRAYPWGHEDTELQSYARQKLNERKDSALLKFGHCAIEVVDDDTLIIERTLDGVDALGRKATTRGAAKITIQR